MENHKNQLSGGRDQDIIYNTSPCFMFIINNLLHYKHILLTLHPDIWHTANGL